MVNIRPWEEFIPEGERERYKEAGYWKKKLIIGERPAFIIIDVTEGYVGSKENDKFATFCPDAEVSVKNIASLLEKCREKKYPVIFTTGDAANDKFYGGATKRPRNAMDFDPRRDLIVKELTPLADELVIKKSRASAFFATPLAEYLYRLKTDTLIVSGATTSGCVRASVVDAFSYGFNVIVVEELVFDRAQKLHLANLFDMNAKYAEVITMETILKLLG